MSDNIRVGLVVAGTVDKSMVRTVAQTGRYGKQLTDTFKTANKQFAATGDVLKYQNRIEKLNRQVVVATGDTSKLNRKIHEKTLQLRKSENLMRKYGLSVRNAGTEHRRLQRDLDRTARGIQRVDRHAGAVERFRRARYGLAAVGGALYGASRFVGAAREDQRTGQRLATVMGGEVGAAHSAAGREVAWARAQAFGDAPLIASAQDLLSAQYSLRSADNTLTADEARVGAAVAHRLATVLGGGDEDTAALLATVNNTLGGSISDSMSESLPKIAELLNATVSKYQIQDLPQLGEALKMTAATASQRGVSPQELLAMVGTVSSGGLTGSMGGTAVNEMLARLPAAAEKLGVRVATDAAGRLDALGTLGRIQTALPAQLQARGDALRELFGETGSRAVGELLPKRAATVADVGTIAAAMSGDAVGEHYRTYLDSETGRIELAQLRLAAVGTTLAATVLPLLAGFVGALGSSAAWLGRVIEGSAVLRFGFVGLGVAAAGVAVAWGLIVTAQVVATGTMVVWNAVAGAGAALMNVYRVGLLKTITATKLWTVATKAMTVAQKVLNFVVRRNPIVAIIMLVIGLAAVVYKVWGKTIGNIMMKFEPLRKFIEGVKSWWGSKGSEVGSAVEAGPELSSGARRPRSRAGPAATAALGAGLASASAVPAQAPDVRVSVPPSVVEAVPAQAPDVDFGAAFTVPDYSPGAGPGAAPIEINYYGGPITIAAPADAGAEELVDLLADRLRGEIERDLSEALRRGISAGQYRLIDG